MAIADHFDFEPIRYTTHALPTCKMNLMVFFGNKKKKASLVDMFFSTLFFLPSSGCGCQLILTSEGQRRSVTDTATVAARFLFRFL
jgi:hypothetical protein